jgi:hypothetical protein
MIRWKSLVLGAVVFGIAHWLQITWWREWFEPSGDYSPWFLNSGRAVAVTAGLLFVTGVLLGIVSRGVAPEAIVAGGNLAAGAVAAMGVVLGVTGPGTLFPIALTIGAGIAAISAIAGTLAGSLIGKAL